MDFDPLLLSRIQFGFVVSFHILFPGFTIGLASWLAMLEGLWLATGQEAYKHLFKFWVKIFAVSFGMGVVSGIVMSFQFGTNWSVFSRATGNVLGPLIGYEVMTAFFLEAAFLGIMLFGWERVGNVLHFISTCIVAIGTLISTFWIIAANSWMHTPAGYELRDGIFYAADWLAIIFNPSFPYRLVHMVLAAYLTTSFVVGGISAWYLWKNRCVPQARRMFAMAVGFIAIVAPLQIIAGDFHGLNVREHQPAKLAAMEGHWKTEEAPVPLLLFAVPDAKQEENRYEVGVPYLGSLILTHTLTGAVEGLKDFPPEDRPPVAIIFWTFRVMVALGFLMAFVGLYGFYLWRKGRLYSTRWFQALCMLMTPAGFVALVAGWLTAEIGRQPYVVYGLLRTADARSPINGGSVAFSLAVFFIVYLFIFGMGSYYLIKLIRRGPDAPEVETHDHYKQPMRPLSYPDEPIGAEE